MCSTEKSESENLPTTPSTSIQVNPECATSESCAPVILSSDRGLHDPNIKDDGMKREIIAKGPCQPKGPFRRDEKQNNRCFSESYYYKMSKAGVQLPRAWLCYSPTKNFAYCEPCWLFANRSASSFNEAWINGISDWVHLSDRIKTHEYSREHLNACIALQLWRSEKTIDTKLNKEIDRMKNYWKNVLHRIVNTTITLATCNLPFRGHRESTEKFNSGNFISVIQLLAQYDPVLKELLEKGKGCHKYLSHQIQNEIIQLIAIKIEEDIVKEINDAPFFSIIIDTTQDNS